MSEVIAVFDDTFHASSVINAMATLDWASEYVPNEGVTLGHLRFEIICQKATFGDNEYEYHLMMRRV